MQRIFPFLWLHGESEEQIVREIEAIRGANLSAFCVESRPHPDFCGPLWWRDMDIVLKRAQELDMEVWVLDDRQYPTGYANGKLEQHRELRQWHIAARNADAVGSENGMLLLERDEEDELLGAYALEHRPGGFAVETATDLTANVRGNVLRYDLPPKLFRFVTIWKTRAGSERENYIDMLNAASVRVLIDAVYEPHYHHYKDFFGKTLRGFFSDEPRFGNFYNERSRIHGTAYDANIGTAGLAMPFSEQLLQELYAAGYCAQDLLRLWYGADEKTSAFRRAFMRSITRQYAENFTEQIGTWCRERGVCYAGHIIEDMNAHTHTACSAGHYFKSQQGQDLAGIDVVLHQIKPFSLSYDHLAPVSGGIASPAFFCYTLPALARSCALLDKNKQGRALCELFGAYGFGESISDMKWIADLMLANGITHFIPHAFSAKEPDEDCPPQFYCAGKNPAYRPFGALMRYMDEVSGMTAAGRAVIHCGVLYHAEAEWSAGENAPVDGVMKVLADAQIPAMIVPYDRLNDAEALDVLIVPWAERIPPEWEEAAGKFGLERVMYAPRRPTKAFAARVAKSVRRELVLTPARGGVVVYPFCAEGETNFLVFNAGAVPYRGVVRPGCGVRVNAVRNFQSGEEYGVSGDAFALALSAGECVALLARGARKEKAKYKEVPLGGAWRVRCEGTDNKARELPDDTFANVYAIGESERFSGSVVYEREFSAEEGEYRLDLGDAGGSVLAELDGQSLGWRIGAPYAYTFRLSGAGKHALRIEVSGTPVMERRDPLSLWNRAEPLGLLCRPRLWRKR